MTTNHHALVCYPTKNKEEVVAHYLTVEIYYIKYRRYHDSMSKQCCPYYFLYLCLEMKHRFYLTGKLCKFCCK